MNNPHIGDLIRQITLPRPYSVNAALSPGYRKARQYRRWRAEAATEIMAQGPRLLIDGPVFIDMIFPADACSKQCDTDNQAKCMLDALVDMRILIDDNRTIVPVLLLRWGPGDKTLVRIHEFMGEMF